MINKNPPLLISIFLTILLMNNSYAGFCPNNFNLINVGDSLEEVIKKCGKPDQQKEVNTPNENIPQEWSYYNAAPVSPAPSNPPLATMKTNVTFDSSGKVINISVNGIGVGATTICGSNIQLGDTRSQIQSACGQPTFVTKQNTPGATPPAEIKKTELIYQGNTPATLIFEDGKFVGSK